MTWLISNVYCQYRYILEKSQIPPYYSDFGCKLNDNYCDEATCPFKEDEKPDEK